ncbi:MAG: hypothetical protein IJM59_01510 [Proteobacteria bacterium]|nr:hypothetical protein [Pseudomonadota bacterium]
MRNPSAFRYCVFLGTAIVLGACSDLAYEGQVDVCIIPSGDSNAPCACSLNSPDDDNNGVPDCVENHQSECPAGSLKQTPGVCGCDREDTDTDGDGTPDCQDMCPKDPKKNKPDVCGCGVVDEDANGNGIIDCVENAQDLCPEDPDKTLPGICGCGVVDEDANGNGVIDCVENGQDLCPADPDKTEPGKCGCGVSEMDSDSDTIPDCLDMCPFDPNKDKQGECGCGNPETMNCQDPMAECPEGSLKTHVGICGCDTEDTDTDGDGTPDCQDKCPADPEKTEPGECGCGAADIDGNGNGIMDCKENVEDECPADPNKTKEGECGCGVPETGDTDGDTIPDCKDLCKDDPEKTEPGECGCGVPETGDTDGDTIPDCKDLCKDDPKKAEPGVCGCDEPETGDTDGDEFLDCVDECPLNPDKQKQGNCGCNVADVEGGCGDTFHIYEAKDLFDYKTLGDKCSKYPNVVLHGKINLYDHYGDTGTHELGTNGDCNPVSFVGEKYHDNDPEIVFEAGGERGKVSSPLFWSENSKSLSLRAENLKLSYDVEGDVRGVLAHYMDNSELRNVHYKGNDTVHVNNRLISSAGKPDYLGGIAGIFKGSAQNVSFEGDLHIDMAGDPKLVIGFLGGIFGYITNAGDDKIGITDILFKGNITIQPGVDARNIGGVVGNSFSVPVSGAVFDGGTLTYEPTLSSGKYKDGTCVGGIVGLSDNSQISESGLTDASVMAGVCDNVGGIVGCLQKKSTLTGNCKESTAKVINGYQNVGGVVGQAVNSSITKISNHITGEISGARVLGGFGGYFYHSNLQQITNNVNKVSGSDFVAGFAGQFDYSMTVKDVVNEVTTIDVKYKVNTEQGKAKPFACAGGFASYMSVRNDQESTVSFSGIQSTVKDLLSTLGTRLDENDCYYAGTGGFLGCLQLYYSNSTVNLSKIYSTVNNLQSANHSAGFAGDSYMDLPNRESFSVDNSFFWSNITNSDSNAHNAGILGDYGWNGNRFTGTYTRVVSVSRFKNDGMSLFAFSSNIDKCWETASTNKSFYYYFWKDGVSAFPGQARFDNFVPFGVSNGVKTADQVVNALNNGNNDVTWTTKNFTVDGKNVKFPVFTATQGCQNE